MPLGPVLMFGLAGALAATALPAEAQVPGGPPGAPVAQVPPVHADTPAAQVVETPLHIQTADEALAQDAAEYAQLSGVSAEEAIHRMLLQEETVPATDALAGQFKRRLAGISIEHHPGYRIVVLLTGSKPVDDQYVVADGAAVPIVFHTGAGATRDKIVAAIVKHQAEIRAVLPHPPAMGADLRTGELVVMVNNADSGLFSAASLKSKFEAIAGVPVSVRRLARDENMAVEGGSRVVGTDPADGRRYACTTGFVVTDGARTGVVTAAHCPDNLSYIDTGHREIPLTYIGQWGWGFQDVQVNVSDQALRPLFYADTAKSLMRPVTGLRARASTRAGDLVCHRGEKTGYSCAQVELTDFAPSGDLCGGPCLPTWVSVAGPKCQGGDSGAPVFNGTIAFGIVKGGVRRADGTCSAYYYMSTDYLPKGWSLLRQQISEAGGR
jgi:hypothetical protein